MNKITSVVECREYYNRYNKPPKGWMYDGPYYAHYPDDAIKCVKELKEYGYKAFYVKEKRAEMIRLGGDRREASYNYRVIRTSYRVKKTKVIK
jgi:hypothetical protein